METEQNKTSNASSKHVRLKRLLGTREIKFRAWYSENKNSLDECMQYYESWEQIRTLARHAQYERPDFIMQFIGIKDKNANEIYDGDIIKHSEKIVDEGGEWDYVVYKVVVQEDDQDSVFHLKSEYEITTKHFACITQQSEGNEWEIAGNIFENLELLGECT